MNDKENSSEADKRSFLKTATSGVAAAAGVASIVAVLGSLTAFWSDAARNDAREAVLKVTQAEINHEIRKVIESKVGEIDDIKSRLAALSNPPVEGQISVQLSDVTSRVLGLEKKLTTIEKAIVDNPERAMSIPILRRDLDAFRTDVQGDLVGTRREIERVYDLSKWFIGLMATMAIGILGLAVGNLVKTK